MRGTNRRALLFLLSLFVFAVAARAQNVITTVVGNGRVFRGDGGPTTTAALGRVYGVAVDTAGNLYLTDSGNHLVLKVSPRAGGAVINVIAGNNIAGFSGDRGPAISASLNVWRGGLTVDQAGNLYICDDLNARIRKVSPAGIITTYAGGGSALGDGGPAVNASFWDPRDVAMDQVGNLYVADLSHHRIRKIDASGVITTVAGNGVAGFSGDGGSASSASLNFPSGVALDAAGNLYIADKDNERIRKVSPSGIISTVAGNGVADRTSGDGGPATQAALNAPVRLAVDRGGNLYVATNTHIRKVDAKGVITTVANTGAAGFSGDGGPAVNALLNFPTGLALDSGSNLYIADTNNGRIRKVTADGIISTIAGVGLINFSGDGGAANLASLSEPVGVVADAAGNVFVSDTYNHRIRKVSADGVITTVAGNGMAGFSGDGGSATRASLNEPGGAAIDQAGNVYVADFRNNRIRKIDFLGTITTAAGTGSAGFSGDGGPATNARLWGPADVTRDAVGNLYIADSSNSRLRRVSTDGAITTVAGSGTAGFSGDGGPAVKASLDNPTGVAIDSAGNLYIADSGNSRVRKVTPDGVINTVAGGGSAAFSYHEGDPATSAQLYNPTRVAVDAAGNLYIGHTNCAAVSQVGTDGKIRTVAGKHGYGFSGDGGLATSAKLNFPVGVAFDARGNLYIADRDNQRIRKVLAAAPSFTASPLSLSFSATAGAAARTAQQITLSGTIAGLAWTATARTSSGGNWLSVSPASGQVPATISVSVDATNLAAGSYEGSIAISVPVAFPSLATIAVTLTVTAAQPASLSVQPTSLSFRVAAGAAAPPAHALRIENSGGGVLSWTAQASSVTGSWLKVSAPAGTAPASLQVSVNAAGLAAGSYTGSISVQSLTTNQSVSVAVSLVVSSPGAALLLSSTHLYFRAVQGGGADPPQQFGVLNVGAGALDWSAQPSVSWLQVSPASGQGVTPTGQIPMVDVSVDASGLSAGLYTALIRVTSSAANNSPQVLKVNLQVLPAGTPLGAVVRPSGLIFRAVTGGSSPGSQNVMVYTTEQAPIGFLSNTFDADWVKLSPERNSGGTASRDSPARIVVQPDLEGLAAQVYRGALGVYTANDQNLYRVSLLFVLLPTGTVLPADGSPGPAARHEPDGEYDGAMPCTPSKLLLQFASVFSSFNAVVGWPATVLVNLGDDCGNPAVGGQVVLSFSNGDSVPPLTDLNNGQYHGFWRPAKQVNQVIVTARGLWRGLEAAATAIAQVDSNPDPKGLLNQGGVVLAAGYQRGPVAPGSIISLFGQRFTANEGAFHAASALPLSTKLGGVRVLIADKEAPLFYVGYGQVNAQVPADVPSGLPLQVMVETDGVLSAPEPLQTVSSQPGIFTMDPKFGAQQGAVLIANTDRLAMRQTPGVPSEPVARGGYISIFCTGLGATDPAVASGQPGPSSEPLARVKTPVSVSIGGQSADVIFAGMAPGFAAVYQVNAQVPDGVTPGDAVPVVITQGAMRSNTVTIAVK